MNVVLLCVAALTLLLLGLSVNVSRLRRKSRSTNPPSDFAIPIAVRAQGNASEYIPVFIALLLYMNTPPILPNAFVMPVAMLALISRVVHAIGMLNIRTVEQRHIFRPLGALGTYVSLLLLGGALLFHAL